nr:hypothetical protein [Tanacetum cinerariifolium]
GRYNDAHGDDSVTHGEFLTVSQEPSIPSPTPPTPLPQPPQDLPLTSQVQQTPPQSPQRVDTFDDIMMDDESNQGRMIAEMDKDDGRQAESQAEIYKIDMDHANKVLSMQEDETNPTEVQEVVDVTTAKLITESVLMQCLPRIRWVQTGYLKFSAKGTKREVFGMPILGSLITADLREVSYYKEYLANVVKHRWFLSSEPARKPNPTAQKVRIHILQYLIHLHMCKDVPTKMMKMFLLVENLRQQNPDNHEDLGIQIHGQFLHSVP